MALCTWLVSEGLPGKVLWGGGWGVREDADWKEPLRLISGSQGAPSILCEGMSGCGIRLDSARNVRRETSCVKGRQLFSLRPGEF